MLTEPRAATDTALGDWLQGNQHFIAVGLARLREFLGRRAEGTQADDDLLWMLDDARAILPAPPVLDRLAARFGLTQFETDILLLCAAVEMDGTFAGLVAAARSDGRTLPTFSLALTLLPGAHWSALTPDGPLRRWELL